MEERNIKQVAIIRTDFTEKFGIPRQSGRVKSAIGKIIFEKEFSSPDAIRGIEKFSHLWLIFDFSLSHTKNPPLTVRPPRLGGNKRVGVFASRSPFRPNSLGLSSVKLEKVLEDGSLLVSGVDILDNTPIFDIKPYIPYADIHAEALGDYAEENKNHRLVIADGEKLLNVLPEEKRQTAIDCLLDDPRPSYQNDGDRIYSMLFSGFDIHFKVNGNEITIVNIEKK